MLHHLNLLDTVRAHGDELWGEEAAGLVPILRKVRLLERLNFLRIMGSGSSQLASRGGYRQMRYVPAGRVTRAHDPSQSIPV